MVLDVYDRGRVAATLAAERQIPDERVAADAGTAEQEQPRDVGDAPAPRADGARVGVARFLRLGDGAGPPGGIGSWRHPSMEMGGGKSEELRR